jgi:prepilin-type N-terminal cleavage/methylation domain-containing protein
MMSQTTKTSETEWNDRARGPAGFTLLELIIVLAIIAAMVTVIMPYATRSNQHLSMEQECLSIAEAIRYAMNLSVDTNKPTRLVLSPDGPSYSVEIASGKSDLLFQPAEDIYGAVHYLGQDIYLMDVDGFSMAGKRYYLLFDPAGAWPQATISLASRDAIRTIRINGRQVEIEDSTS